MPRAPAGGSCDCFLQLDQVPGEASDSAFAGTIEVVGWNWGISARGEQVAGALRPKAAPDVRHFTFLHVVDSATAGLWSRCANNGLIPTGKLTQRRAAGPSAQRFLEIEFKQVRIVEVGVMMSEENQIPLETVSFAFESVTMDYTPQAATGGAKSGRHSFTWMAGTAR